MHLRLAFVVAGLALGLGVGCGTVASTSDGGGTGGSTAGQGGSAGAVGSGGSGGSATGGAGGSATGGAAQGGHGGGVAGSGGGAAGAGGAGGSIGKGGAGGGHAGAGGQGGRGSGGAAGSSRGGAGGAAGMAGAGGSASGGGGGSTSHGECTQASDCVLHDDCCTCASVPKTDPGATCNIACLADLCSTRGITASDVACVAGRCALSLSCNPKNITCTIPTPACGAGTLAGVRGNCFAGGCLPVAQCADVASCDTCTSAGLVCVTDQVLGGPTFHCVTVPSSCSSAPTCQCLGVCTGGFQCGDPSSTTPLCDCPTC
jgi:hypothetical protein